MRAMAEPITLEMSLEEAMSTQRAIRRLKDDPVDDDLVLHLIELALKAPTGSNAQNWEMTYRNSKALVPQRFAQLREIDGCSCALSRDPACTLGAPRIAVRI